VTDFPGLDGRPMALATPPAGLVAGYREKYLENPSLFI
jgi:hypothetical protein